METATAIGQVQDSKTYLSRIPWQKVVQSEAIVIHCSDPHFQEHFDDFLKNHLQIAHPTHIIIPGGITLMLPLMGKGFKFGKQIIEFVSDLSKARRIICIAHEDCMMYKEHKILDWALSKVGKNIKEIQFKHLKEAGSTFEVWFPGAEIQLYYADVEKQGDGEFVVFKEVT